MCPYSGGTYREENEIRTQEIKDRPMANRKYDYSEDVQQPAEAASEMSKTSETEEATAVSAEEARRERLEQRNDALANEFRRLKPEIAEAHKKLNKLIEGIGAYAGTMINLHDLLKTSFPIRLTKDDIQALLEEVNAIADNAISHIRREREKADKDIRRNEDRISMTQATFWCMIALLLNLASFFAVIVFANMKLIHSKVLTQISVVYSGLTVLTIIIAAYIYRKK